MKTFTRSLLVFGLAALSSLPAFAKPASFKKVMIVVFENEDAEDVLSQPNFRRFAQAGAYLSNFKAETHPSQPNYIALVAGETYGVHDDGNVDINARHIGDLIENAHYSWKTYLEGYPGGCFTGAKRGDYVRKHNPFISFLNIQNDPARCAKHLVPSTELAADIAAGNLPDYSLYVPDLRNDGHDTGVAFADQWFGRTFGPMLKDPRFMRDMLVIATFDESELTGGNRIYTALYGDGVIPGSTNGERYDHYSILSTIEDVLGLGSLNRKDHGAPIIRGIWK